MTISSDHRYPFSENMFVDLFNKIAESLLEFEEETLFNAEEQESIRKQFRSYCRKELGEDQ